ncbi:pectinesterase family protein [Fibrobacter sp. UWEL]|uniref:pectinesterase family protein n=1 Tax=Fibrobacter sp. UWEL TaxID=1896209 RepID=UPI0009199B24|nr:pectinesterase family protein [Fibrobacter sp. UWEL]SHK63045.1 Por secretion system C-terminal sorting domain-containing protein [Fibrobacter sp. UWEL]
MNKVALTLVFGLAAGFAADAFAVTKKKFDFVVGVDGDFKAAVAAAAAANPSESNRFVIFFPEGEYNITNLTGDSNGKSTFSTSYVSFVGQTRDKTTISNTTTTEGISVTATLYFPKNNGMYMQDLTIENKSSAASATAARQVTIQQNSGDKFIYKNVRLVSGQDTYYTKSGRAYWEGGEIQGTVDYICGGGDVWFEGTNLVTKRNGGYITASQNPGDWGYIFNNTTLNATNGAGGTFYLGRSWGKAKVVFLNTTMYAQPTAAGWGPDMNSAPVVFGEYNSKNGNGGAVNTSQRKTYFSGGKDGSTASLKTVWSASDASKYTLANVMGGSDGWAPNKLTVQMSAPKISQEGSEIVWANDENARCWAVFVNGKFKTSVASNSFDLNGVAVGSKVTVRAANSMGGLGATSNEVATVESNVTYYKVSLNNGIGGTIESNLSGDKVAEGKTATFTAKPIDGWKLAGWTGASAPSNASASMKTLEIVATGDIELGATFMALGETTFQAESGILENAINESTNAGYAGSGYVNFGAGNSYVNIPVYADAAGTYKMEMFFANGSSSDRDLIVKALGSSSAGSETLTFEKTGAWTTYLSKETEIELPEGASYIQFAVVGSNDGPNLDQIVLTPLKVEEVPDPSLGLAGSRLQNLTSGKVQVQLFSVQGKFIRSLSVSNLDELSNTRLGIPAGSYLIRIEAPGYRKQQVIRVQ